MKKTRKTIQERLVFIVNYIKNFMFIIIPLCGVISYTGWLVIKDTTAYKRVFAVVEWYEDKSKSFAVGLRVNKEKKDGELVYKIIYKATNGETYPAVYSKEKSYWFYMDDNGEKKECH